MVNAIKIQRKNKYIINESNNKESKLCIKVNKQMFNKFLEKKSNIEQKLEDILKMLDKIININ